MEWSTKRYYKDYNHEEPTAPLNDPNFTPTDAPGGSKAKVEVMAKRYALGLPLYHPDDSPEYLTEEEKIQEVYRAVIARSAKAAGNKAPECHPPSPLSLLEELKLPQIPTQL